MRTIGILRMAKKQVRILNPALRKQFQRYVDGINTFIKAGRTFSPHQKDLVEDFMDGSVQYWWFSDAAIKAHAKKTLTLAPANRD